MQRRTGALLIVGLLASMALASPAFAQARAESFHQRNIEAAIKAQGFSILEVSSTFLGRVRILAARDNRLREIIFSPNTGEIKRDVFLGYVTSESGQASTATGNASQSESNGGLGGTVAGAVDDTLDGVDGVLDGVGDVVDGVGDLVDGVTDGLGL